jgi:hypothetical protein
LTLYVRLHVTHKQFVGLLEICHDFVERVLQTLARLKIVGDAVHNKYRIHDDVWWLSMLDAITAS